MEQFDGCPLCDKPVVGTTALHGHLEFGHDIDDPAEYLERMRRPAARTRRDLSGLRRLVGGVVGVAVLAAGGFFAYTTFVVDGDADTASAATGSEATDSEPATTEPTTTAPEAPPAAAVPAETAPPETAPPETAPPETAPPATAAPSTTAAPAGDTDFRAPFLLDARTAGCTTADGNDVHELAFRFSGARDITFDGTFFADDTGDGERTTTHALPAGTTGYLDHVVVVDPAGGEHEVAIEPPLYLGACAAG